MNTDDLVLKPYNFREDTEDLYGLISNYDEQIMFHSLVCLNSCMEFEQWMIDNFRRVYLDFRVIKDIKNYNTTIGYAYAYDYRRNDLNCKLCLFLKKEYRDSGLGAFATIKYMDLLFRCYPIRKIYFDIYDYNKQSLKSNLQAGFIEEGCLKEYRYHNGSFYDLHILSMDRETFYNKFGSML